MLEPADTRLHAHNQGVLAYLHGCASDPPPDCDDPEGWRRGYASARAALVGER